MIFYSNHIFMGFTMCGQFFVSYTERMCEDLFPLSCFASYEYELYLWRFVPGQKLQFVSKHKIFKHLKSPGVLDKVKIMQFPRDLYKLVCYGLTWVWNNDNFVYLNDDFFSICFSTTNPDLIHITILTLPAPKNCRHCCKMFSITDGKWIFIFVLSNLSWFVSKW